MKRVLPIIVSVIIMGCLSGAAWAVPMTWTDTFTPPNGNVYIGPNYTYLHDITNDGFNPGSDLVESFSLHIDLLDDGDRGWEIASVTLDNLLWAGLYDGSKDIDLGYGILGSLLLLEDGQLNVTLSSTLGDFYFVGSTLTADGCGTAPVPEPATLMLLGSGLLGLAGFRKKMKK
jgi:hypothetical protein